MNEHDNNNFFSGLVLGAIIGAGFIYFLNSTDEGKKLKKQLKEGSQDALDDLMGVVADFEEKGKEFKQKVEKIQAEIEEKAGNAISLSQIEKLRERGRKAVKFFCRNGKSLV